MLIPQRKNVHSTVFLEKFTLDVKLLKLGVRLVVTIYFLIFKVPSFKESRIHLGRAYIAGYHSRVIIRPKTL